MRHSAAWGIILDEGFALPEGLADGTAAEACARTLKAVGDYVESSEDVHAFLQAAIDAKLPFCPQGCTGSQLAAYLGNGVGDVHLSDPELLERFTDEFLRPLQNFRDEQIDNALALKPEWVPMRLLVQASAKACAAATELWLRWHALVAKPYQRMAADDRESYDAAMKPVLNIFDYTVPAPGEDALGKSRAAWITAMPNQVNALCVRLEPLRPVFGAYIDAMLAALRETDVAKIDAAWAAVDRAWIDIPHGLFVPVHGMENGEHAYRVSPGFRLSLRITTAADETMIREAKQSISASLGGLGIGTDGKDEASQKIERSDVGVFLDLASGGHDVVSRTMGQVLPNRQEIMALGGRIFLQSPDDASVSAQTYAEYVHRFCAPATIGDLAGAISGEIMTHTTTSHELFHPVGRSKDIDDALGAAQELLEEAKATIGGLVTVPGNRLQTIAMTVARICRFMHDSRRKNRSYQPYTRENLVALQTMLDAGLLECTDAGIAVDPSEDRIDAWYAKMREFVERTLAAYQARDTDRLRELRAAYCGQNDEGSSDEAKAVIAWVNPPTAA